MKNTKLDTSRFSDNRNRKVLIILFCVFAFLTVAEIWIYFSQKNQRKKWNNDLEKNKRYMLFFEKYFINKAVGKRIEAYFLDRKMSRIAIYGGGVLGQLLYEDLKNSEIEIKYVIDRNVDVKIGDLNTISPDCVDNTIDVIVVTAIMSFDDVFESLEDKVPIPIVSIDEIIRIL